MFVEYISECQYTPVWKRIVTSDTPTMRGGHQMCMDSDTGILYMFGGWDGGKDLADFWAYNSTSATWRCLSEDTRKYF
jgi:hypothetical protein